MWRVRKLKSERPTHQKWQTKIGSRLESWWPVFHFHGTLTVLSQGQYLGVFGLTGAHPQIMPNLKPNLSTFLPVTSQSGDSWGRTFMLFLGWVAKACITPCFFRQRAQCTVALSSMTLWPAKKEDVLLNQASGSHRSTTVREAGGRGSTHGTWMSYTGHQANGIQPIDTSLQYLLSAFRVPQTILVLITQHEQNKTDGCQQR